MSSGNPKIVINLDRKEKFTETAGWLAHLAVLQGALPPGLLVDDPLVGSWRACHVEVVDPDAEAQSEAVTELAALYALEGLGSRGVYWNVVAKFADISPDLWDLVARHARLHDLCFGAAAAMTNFSRLTLKDAERLLWGTHGPLNEACFQAHKSWLARQPGVPARVRDVLEHSPDWADEASFDSFAGPPCKWVIGPTGEAFVLPTVKAPPPLP
jgi:hypothetical protein